MPATGEVVGDLYVEGQGGQKQPLASPPPPEPPSPIPAPPPVVVIAKQRKMMDQNSDGSIRDTSSEALNGKNDLQFRGVDAEPKEAAPPPAQEPATPPPAPPVSEPPKLYAGKYKTPEDMEKGYQEAQSALTKANQKAAELERKATVQAAIPPQPQPTAEEQKNQLLKRLVEDPQGVLSEIAKREIQTTAVAVAANQATMEWKAANKDIADLEPYFMVDVQRMLGETPDLALNPQALLSEATTRFRAAIGKLRTDAAREALTTETRVVPLLQDAGAPPEATEHPPQKAPLSNDEAYESHMRFLKVQERRTHRGLRP